MHFTCAMDPYLLAMGNCALRIINFRAELYAYVISASDSSLISSITQQMSNISYVLVNQNTISKLQLFTWKASLYILIVDEINQYELFVNRFYRTYAWNPRGTFLIIYLGDGGLSEILKTSWKYYALHTYILDKSLTISSYFPYDQGRCGENLQLVKVYTCSKLTTTDVNHLYTNKVPNQFNRCPFIFQVLQIAPFVIKLEGEGEVGFEIQMLREVAYFTNTTLLFANHSNREWGIKMIDGKYSNMVADLLERKMNGMAGLVPATAELRRYFDVTSIHSFENSLIFVPAGKHVEGWKNLQMVYKENVWVSLLGVFMCVSLALWLGAMVHQKCKAHRRLDYWFFYALCASCSALPRLPRLVYFRYVVCIWICFFFILSSVFQCKLLTFLVKPSFEHAISSFEELIESEMPIAGYFTVVTVIQDSDAEVELQQQLSRRWINCTLAFDCLTRAAEQRDIAAVHGERVVQYQLSKRFLHPNGVAKLKPLHDKRFPFAICFYLDKGLPYFEKMEKLVVGLKENGLFSKWVNDLQYKQNKILLSNEIVRLNIHHLILPFAFLIVGYIIASCALLLELIHYKLSHNKKVNGVSYHVFKIA